MFVNGGNSASQACYSPEGFLLYQTTSTFNPYVFHYRGNTACSSSVCDWYCYRAWLYYDSSAWNTCNTCGAGSSPYFCAYSDETLKSGIKTLQNALAKLMEIDAVEYDWNENLSKDLYEYFKRKNRLHTIGLIAQNVRKYFPEAVTMNGEGYYSIEYSKLNAVLVEAIKEQQVFIDDIKGELDWIENKIN
jgi:hypothetical protein